MLKYEYNKIRPYPLPKSAIDVIYCNPMLQRQACKLTLTHNCSMCLPILQGAITDLEGANNEAAIIVWRLKRFAAGKSWIWTNEEKKSIEKDHFSQEQNPFKKLSDRMEELYESTPTIR